MASPSAGAPALKYGDVNTETTSPSEVKGLKGRVKNRISKNLEELKIITIDEWNKIPTNFIQKLFKNFCQKIIMLKWGRLDSFYLNQIRKEMKKVEKEDEDKNQEKKDEKQKMVKKRKKFKIKNCF